MDHHKGHLLQPKRELCVIIHLVRDGHLDIGLDVGALVAVLASVHDEDCTEDMEAGDHLRDVARVCENTFECRVRRLVGWLVG